MSGISGDFERLGRLIQAAGASDEIRLELAADMASWIGKRTQQSFWTHRDPYGETWEPRSPSSKRTNALLVDTAAYMTGFISSVTADSIEITNAVPYARFLNDGTANMPARSSLPREGDGLGEWLEPLVKLAATVIEKRLGDW